MSVDQSAGPEEGLARYRSFIKGQLSSGTDASTVVQRLVEMGVSQADAVSMVTTVQADTIVSVRSEPLEGGVDRALHAANEDLVGTVIVR